LLCYRSCRKYRRLPLVLARSLPLSSEPIFFYSNTAINILERGIAQQHHDTLDTSFGPWCTIMSLRRKLSADPSPSPVCLAVICFSPTQ